MSAAFSSKGNLLALWAQKDRYILCCAQFTENLHEIVPGPAEQLDNMTSKTFSCSYFLLHFFFKVACSKERPLHLKSGALGPEFSPANHLLCDLGQISYCLTNSILPSMN